MTIATITTAWGRPELTEVVFEYMSGVRVRGVDLVHHVAISPEDPHAVELESIATRHGYTVHLTPNEPLAEKWNGVLRESLRCKPDFVLVLGSDDIVNFHFIESAILSLYGKDYCWPGSVHFYDMESGRLISREMNQTGIRMFTRSAVERCERVLWDESNPRAMAMDSAQDRRISALRGGEMQMGSAVVVDIKHPTQHRISYRRYANNLSGTSLEPVSFFSTHFPGVLKRLQAL